MAALATTSSVHSWIPEDDFLLKNAVEAGASLEALAKGAVQFSRKFTIRELRDRWYSLLYDTDIAAEASARMVEFEVSGPNTSSKISRPGGLKESPESSVKRKVESIRRLYYAMRKKTCMRSLKSADVGFLGTSDANDRMRDGGSCRGESLACNSQPPGASCILDDHDRDPFGFGRTECYTEHPVGLPTSYEDRGHDDNALTGPDRLCVTKIDSVPSEAVLEDRHNGDGLNYLNSISENDFADLSESLLNFSNEDELIFEEADRKNPVDKSCNTSLSSVLVSSQSDLHDDVSNAKRQKKSISNLDIRIPSNTFAAEVGILGEGSTSDNGLRNPLLSTSSPVTRFAEYMDGEVECIINTEDSEIPCNDDVFISKETTSSGVISTSKGADYLTWLLADENDDRGELIQKDENPAKSVRIPQLVRLDILPVTSPRQINNTPGDPSEFQSDKATPNSAVGGMPKELVHVCKTVNAPLHVNSSSLINSFSTPTVDHLASNHEESGSDDDVPSYSDIEAMILEMDLCQDEPDSCINTEVCRYQNEDAKRTIIRLEQCARSSMQRSIASRGAFAVFYGRHLKHYIKEPEVMIGRATDDMDVDIDLGREGPANKISRRQALIRMEGDGSFHLKNLGKNPVYVNGKEVATGQSMSLGSNSLIEIRGMAFVFEVSSKCVRPYLVNVAKRNRENSGKFEWSE
ncbi:hypothetical protein K2173_006155 [Erythroxylum novogranatense]|uniref:FHA domain-containing protein n=1 Tax=Erythroxylum novogranatense TaxID=1862640 RepID=A0AAV8TEH1_9ROSI|nr:hypothetical protein K2173_006155 [Erythroxylum novogranatense]